MACSWARLLHPGSKSCKKPSVMHALEKAYIAKEVQIAKERRNNYFGNFNKVSFHTINSCGFFVIKSIDSKTDFVRRSG